MEKEKSNKGLIGALVAIIVLLLLALGYVLFGNKLLNKNTNTTTATNNINISNSEADKLYTNYLKKLETALRKELNKQDYTNTIDFYGKSILYETSFYFEIDKNLNLAFTGKINDKEYNKYHISDNVIKMSYGTSTNGGYTIIIFLKSDGSLYQFSVESLGTEPDPLRKIELNRIVDWFEINRDNEYDGWNDLVFIDIEGNIFND